MRKLLTSLTTVFSSLFVTALAFAQEHGGMMAGGDSGSNVKSVLAISSGLAIAIAAFGGALGQSRAAAAALDGIARNPGASGKVQTPMIIALALIESLVIYALVIAFLLQGKI